MSTTILDELSNLCHQRAAGHCFVVRNLMATLAAGLMLCCWTISAVGALPSLTGSEVVHFSFSPDDPNQVGDQSFWFFNGHSDNLVLTLPAVMDISAIPGPGILSWATPANWTTFPLDTGGFSVGQTGSGTFTAVVNGGQANLDVLRGGGPTEAQAFTSINVFNIHPANNTVCPTCIFGASSNFADTRYNVTLPAGAHLSNDQFEVKVQNLTVNHGASMENALAIIRQNLTNHGSGNFGGTVQGNFINDAVATSGDIANASTLIVNGQLQNSGELNVPGWLQLQSATGNAGTLRINGGVFRPQAAFSNNGTLEFSSGTFGGPGTVTNHGSFQWTGGSFDATGGFAANVVNATNDFTISGAAGKYLFAPITNSGTITQSGGSNFDIGGMTTLTNEAGATYKFLDDSTIGSGFQGGTFSNAGLLHKAGGGGVSNIVAAMNNTGTIRVDTGTLRFSGGGAIGPSTIVLASGAVAEFTGGPVFSLSGTTTASGNGTVAIANNTRVTVPTGNAASFANFTGGTDLELLSNALLEPALGGALTLNLTGSSEVRLAGGRLGGLGNTINNGNFIWSDGSIEGNLTNNSATFTITQGSSSPTLFIGTLTNAATIKQSGFGIGIGEGATLANQAGALFELQDDSDISAGFMSGTMTNAGTLRKSGGTGVSDIAVPFTSTGRITIDSGMLQIGAGALALNSTSTIDLKLSGTTPMTGYSRINAPVGITMAGTLNVSLGGSFSPALGDTFDLFDANAFGGSFATVALPALGTGLAWDANQLRSTGVISVIGDLLGDYNRNGVVDAADFALWRETLGQTSSGWLTADGNRNGTVDSSDLGVWRAHFGETAGSGAAAAIQVTIPEPTGGLLLMAWLPLMARRRQLAC